MSRMLLYNSLNMISELHLLNFIIIVNNCKKSSLFTKIIEVIKSEKNLFMSELIFSPKKSYIVYRFRCK